MYNEKWDQPKRDIFSLSSLIEWLKTKDPEEGYEYCNVRNCLLYQYFHHMGLKDITVGGYSLTAKGFEGVKLTQEFVQIPFQPTKKTFGEALKVAQELDLKLNHTVISQAQA